MLHCTIPDNNTDLLTPFGLLASLCAVSEVSVTTKTAADDISLTYTLDSEGGIISTTPSHLGQGQESVCLHIIYVCVCVCVFTVGVH